MMEGEIPTMIIYICNSFSFIFIITTILLTKRASNATEAENRNEDRP